MSCQLKSPHTSARDSFSDRVLLGRMLGRMSYSIETSYCAWGLDVTHGLTRVSNINLTIPAGPPSSSFSFRQSEMWFIVFCEAFWDIIIVQFYTVCTTGNPVWRTLSFRWNCNYNQCNYDCKSQNIVSSKDSDWALHFEKVLPSFPPWLKKNNPSSPLSKLSYIIFCFLCTKAFNPGSHLFKVTVRFNGSGSESTCCK